MAKTQFKLIRKPRTPKLQFKIVRDEVRKELKPVAIAGQKSYERVVSNWNNKPKFNNRVIVTQNKIAIQLFVKRSGAKKINDTATTADLWKWIDKTGTRPHPISPKSQGGILAFPWGGPGSYQAKTGARPARFGGPGTVQNARPTFRKQVQHPGFPPRKFSVAINRDLKDDFDKAIRRGYRKGFNKAKRA